MNKYTKTLKKSSSIQLHTPQIIFYEYCFLHAGRTQIHKISKKIMPEFLYFICLKQKIQTHTQFSTKSSRHWFILQTVQNVVDCQIDHFQSRFSCGRPDMGRQENIG